MWTKAWHHGSISLRGIANNNYRLINRETEETIETLAENFAYREAHPEAIYILSEEGESQHYRVDSLNIKEKTATLIPLLAKNRQTKPYANLTVHPETLLEHRTWGLQKGAMRLSLWWGDIESSVIGFKEEEINYQGICYNKACGYQKKVQQKEKCQGCHRPLVQNNQVEKVGETFFKDPLSMVYQSPILQVEINNQLAEYISQAVLKLKKQYCQRYNGVEFPNYMKPLFNRHPIFVALHTLGHIMVKALPFSYLISEKDLNGISSQSPNKLRADQIYYLFDTSPDGNGATEALYENWEAIYERGVAFSKGCDCGEVGCPKCLTSADCFELNDGLFKPLISLFS